MPNNSLFPNEIVVVEDNPVNQMILQHMLKTNHPNHHVSVVPSGEEAIAEVEKTKEKIAIIIMDFNMPGINGAETSIRLRELGYRNAIVGVTSEPEKMNAAAEKNKINRVFNKDLTNKALWSHIAMTLERVKENLPVAWNPSFLYEIRMSCQKKAPMAPRNLS